MAMVNGKCKVAHGLNSTPHHEIVLGSGGKAARIHSNSQLCECESHDMAPLLPVTDVPKGWMDLRGSRCGRFQEEKSLPLPGLDPKFFERTAALCNRHVCLPLRADGPVLETTFSNINCQMLFRPCSLYLEFLPWTVYESTVSPTTRI